jgi:hypothetical protein
LIEDDAYFTIQRDLKVEENKMIRELLNIEKMVSPFDPEDDSG